MTDGEPLRVALVAGTLARGGAEKQLFLAAQALRAAGVDARVYGFTRGESYERALRESGIPFECVGAESRPLARLMALTAALRRFRPHVVQSCHTYVNLYAALAAKAIGATSIGTLRSTLRHTRRANGRWTPLLLSAPDALVVNSAAAVEEIAREFPRRRRPVFTVPNAVEARDPGARRVESAGRVTAAFVARLVPIKRLDIFVKGLASARGRAPGLKGIVIGDGPERDAGERLATTLGLTPSDLEFVGALDDAEPRLRRADLLVLTSDEEGFPNVVLEAMTLGLPVVATAVGDVPSAVRDGATGYTVPPGDVEAVAARMAELAEDRELRERLGRAGFDRAREEFGVERLGRRLLDAYRAMGVERAANGPGRDGQSVLMVGVFPGARPGAAMPGAYLATRLEEDGWRVLRASARAGWLARTIEMLAMAWRRRRDYGVAVVDVYSGRAFRWAEAVCGVLRVARRRHVLVLRGGNLPAFSRRSPRRARRLMARADHVVAPSRYLAEELKAYRADIQVIPNGVVLSDFRYRQRERVQPKLIWVRSFHRIYDPVLAVKVTALLRRDVPDLRLTMIGRDRGDGTLAEVRQAIAALGQEEAVTILGGVPHVEIGHYLDDADIFINTTGVDNTPVSVLEAMAGGLCVVSTRIGGIPFLLEDGSDSLLVAPGDADAMAAAVRRLLADPALAAKLSEGARRKAEGFSWDVLLPRWKELLAHDFVPSGSKSARAAAERKLLIVGVFPESARGVARPCAQLASQLEGGGWKVLRTSDRPGRLARTWQMVSTAWRRRRDYGVAVVDLYSGLAFAWAEAVCFVLRAAGRPYVLSLHGGNLPAFSRRWPGRARRLLHSAREVVAPSRYLAEELKALRSDIRVIPNGLMLGDFRFRLRSDLRPRLVWIRTFHAIYDPVMAVRVAFALREDFPDLSLVMIGRDRGDGSLEATRRAVRELGLEKQITIITGVPHAEVGSHLEAADVFLNTTGIDNTPVSVLEAMAVGLCVVSTRVGGLPFLLEDGKDALLVEPGNAEEMAGAVRRLMGDRLLASCLSEHAHRKAAGFDWRAVLPQWQHLLGEVA